MFNFVEIKTKVHKRIMEVNVVQELSVVPSGLNEVTHYNAGNVCCWFNRHSDEFGTWKSNHQKLNDCNVLDNLYDQVIEKGDVL